MLIVYPPVLLSLLISSNSFQWSLGRVLRASQFSLEQCPEALKFVGFLPITQPSAKSCARHPREHVPGAGHAGRGGWSAQNVRGAHGPVRWTTSEVWGSFLVEATKHLIGWTAKHLAASFWWVLSPSCCAPSPSQLLNCANHLSILGGVRRKWAPWAASRTAREAGCSLTHCHFSLGEKCSPRGSLLALSCATLGEKWCRWRRRNHSSYPLQCIQSQIFLLDLLRWTPGLPKRYFCPCVIVQSTFCEGMAVEISYSAIFLTSHASGFISDFMIL